MKKFRANTWDRAIADSVIRHWEYGRDLEFKGAVVVDIGCHIGSFSFLAAMQGAKTVRAFEASPENHAVAMINLELEGEACDLQLHNRAVWRSDLTGEKMVDELYFAPCSEPKNTGGGTVFGDAGKVAVRTIALDTILDEFDKVDILKLDCEGSEFPILLTSKNLHKVQRIVGEYHNMGYNIPDIAIVDDMAQYTHEELKAFLVRQGFEVEIRPSNEHLGKFFARRKA